LAFAVIYFFKQAWYQQYGIILISKDFHFALEAW